MPDQAYVETGKPTPAQTGNEALRTDVTPVNRPIYLVLVLVLGVGLLAGIAGWFVLAFQGKGMPEGLAVIIGAISGGLVGLISGKNT